MIYNGLEINIGDKFYNCYRQLNHIVHIFKDNELDLIVTKVWCHNGWKYCIYSAENLYIWCVGRFYHQAIKSKNGNLKIKANKDI